MPLNQEYHLLWFESFRLIYTGGHRIPVQLHLKQGQLIPAEVEEECAIRELDPFSLLIECNTEFMLKYPEGTSFLLKAKLTDREGGKLFFYSHYSWPAHQIVLPQEQ